VTKQFGEVAAVKNISFSVKEGELMALLGPSGGGKTTVLRMIAGLEMPTSGDVLIRGQRVNDLSVQQRNIGFVFQNYALFKNMTVFKNIAFGLKIKKWKTREIQERVRELLRLFGLEGLEKRYPHQLSGGQRQRVAIARALASKPSVLLLDEPFGAVDAKIRQELREWLVTLHHDLNVTTIFVTHDQEEALEVADRVVVMNHGRVEQVGTPEEVYDRPTTPFVFEFLGHVNRLPTCDGAEAFTRPHEFRVERSPAPASLPARFVHGTAIGPVARLEFALDPSAQTVNVALPREEYRELALRAGEIAYLTPTRQHAFGSA